MNAQAAAAAICSTTMDSTQNSENTTSSTDITIGVTNVQQQPPLSLPQQQQPLLTEGQTICLPAGVTIHVS